ncbi:hypothetical protein P43SY_009376 [Pythium insidiosum]|uniref:polyribonucleotide nucleotidyltransferase n=1 Tax=Pythium insidiosum TaxID=114742 RepID=A0AAD5Q982_PYTIN|nr:hypothetical protein P43SY_009376 [Pythium insidiosum]
MWSASRRHVRASRLLRAPVSARHAMPTALAQPSLAQSQRLQARSFFGLKDLLFGSKTDEKPAVATADSASTTDAAAAAAVAATPSGVAAPAEEAVAAPLEGSKDPMEFSVGKYARLADGGLMARCGKSMVLTTVVSPPSSGRRKDFLPLMVDYRVKYHAAGLIPDTARRNEMTGTDEEILQSRVLDRVIRPLFPRDFADDTQVLATVQSLDPQNDPLVLAINSTSAALAISNIPWYGPVGCVRVVEVDGQLIVNPTSAQRDIATLDILYAANDERTLMIEAAGDEIPEERMAEALRFAHAAIGPVIEQQRELVRQYGKPKRDYTRTTVPPTLMDKAHEIAAPITSELFASPRYSKAERQDGERRAYEAILAGLREYAQQQQQETGVALEDAALNVAAHDVFQHALRERMLSNERNARYDGRSSTTVRGLGVETDVLPMAHGSAVFTRGDTQALCSVTLGPLDRGLRVRSATQAPSDEIEYKHAILHYEFPPYCVNETGRLSGVNRRMVGHGALAEKALVPVIPAIDEFPYTIRMTSETMGSDGSSSMATVCGVTMALMDAGVPIKAPVAGISIGLVTAGDPFDPAKEIGEYRLLTDILGTEDHYGDMDFKVAGTEKGVTAIQLDVKLPGGVPLEILVQGIQQAKKARSFLLKRMSSALAEPRASLKASPGGAINVGVKFQVPTASIGAIIGAGGSNIREIEAATGCTVSIDRRAGEIHVVGPADKVEAAKATILDQTSTQAFYRVGERYEMRVTEVMEFGAILESTAPTKNRGFVHITELSAERVENIHDVLQVGQVLEFQCIQEGVSGKMSRKALLSGSSESPAASGSDASSSKRPASGMHKRRSKPVGAGSGKPPRGGHSNSSPRRSPGKPKEH